MEALLSVNTIFFTLLGYPMSYIEFFGTLFTMWSVWLVVKNKILNWPIGIVGIVLFAILFYQIQLYSDFLEQIYYFVTSFWGWWLWSHPKTKTETDEKNQLAITHNTASSNVIYGISIIVLTLLMGYSMQHIHLWLPQFFPEPATFPYLDAFTTIMSFAATILMAKKKIECWYLWILVDIIGIPLYFFRGTVFLSLLYVIFLLMASKGYVDWKKIYHKAHAT